MNEVRPSYVEPLSHGKEFGFYSDYEDKPQGTFQQGVTDPNGEKPCDRSVEDGP